MQLHNRAYDASQDDFKKLCRFVIDDNRSKGTTFIWQLGRMVDWHYGLWSEEKRFPNFFRKNAQLWVDYFDEIIGFAISENGDNLFYIFVKAGYTWLYPEITQWVTAQWADRTGPLFTEVLETQVALRASLDTAGFVAQGVETVTYRFDLPAMQPTQPALATGFQLSDMATHFDPVGKARLQLNAFQNKEQVTNGDLLAREYVRESPIYTPAFDLSILNAEGEHVAGCEAFIDYANNVAEIERVCTHSDYRRRGFAQTVIRSCFYRLWQHGIGTAFITGGGSDTIALYGKLSHVQALTRIRYTLGQPKQN